MQKDCENSGQKKKKKRGIFKTLGQPELALSWVNGAGRERERNWLGERGLNEKISRRRHGEKLDFLSSCDEYFTFQIYKV